MPLLWGIYTWLFHPLASIPGPFFAKFSKLWIFAVDLSGRSSRKISEIHKHYGPIVRIAPNEVSLATLDAYNDIYGQRTKFLKDPDFYDQVLPKEVVNLFTTNDPVLHSQLRRLFSNAFSRTNVLEFQTAMNEHVDPVVVQARKYITHNKPLPLYRLATSYTTDTISRLTFGESVGALRRPELDHELLQIIIASTTSSGAHAGTHYPILGKLYKLFKFRDITPFLKVIGRCVAQCEAAGSDTGNRSLLHDAVKTAKAMDYEISARHKVTILLRFVGAGFGTIAISISGTLQWIFRDPQVHQRVFKELKTAFPTKQTAITAQALERLPYFQACVKEGIRVACPSPRRLPRLVPAEGYTFDDYRLPKKTKISCSSFSRCYDEDYFPQSFKFRPDRWLAEDANKINASWLPFSKGTRACIGQHMSIVEMELFVARFLRNFEVVEFVDKLVFFEKALAESKNDQLIKVREVLD